MPTPSCNGFESAIARAFRSATEEQICLVATVRLVTPQFLKVRALQLHLPVRVGIGWCSAAELLPVPRAVCVAAGGQPCRSSLSESAFSSRDRLCRGLVNARGHGCVCEWETAPGCYFGMTRDEAGGAFEKRQWCDGVSQDRQPRKHR